MFFPTGRTFFTYPFVVKYIFGLEATSRVEKSNILLRGKKYYHSRKNVRGCDTFALSSSVINLLVGSQNTDTWSSPS